MTLHCLVLVAVKRCMHVNDRSALFIGDSVSCNQWVINSKSIRAEKCSSQSCYSFYAAGFPCYNFMCSLAHCFEHLASFRNKRYVDAKWQIAKYVEDCEVV